MRAVGVSLASVKRRRKLERDAPRQLVAPQLQLEQAKAARERLELERKRESFLARGTELKGHVTRILEVVDADDGVDDLRQFSDEQLADLRSAITAVQHAQTFYEAQHAKDMEIIAQLRARNQELERQLASVGATRAAITYVHQGAIHTHHPARRLARGQMLVQMANDVLGKCPLKRESNDKYALLKRTIAAGDGLASTTAAPARPPSPLPINLSRRRCQATCHADERSSPVAGTPPRFVRLERCTDRGREQPPAPPGPPAHILPPASAPPAPPSVPPAPRSPPSPGYVADRESLNSYAWWYEMDQEHRCL